MDWRDDAACRGMDTELFFPISEVGLSVRQIVVAKVVCHDCPVRDECLSYAIRTGQRGIWGGMTDDERDRLVRDHRWARRQRQRRRQAS